MTTKRALLRRVNDRICELTAAPRSPTASYSVMCECGEPGCVVRIAIEGDVYESIRGDGRSFLVAPGHVTANGDRVLVTGEAYSIVTV